MSAPTVTSQGVSADLGSVLPVSLWKNRVVWGAAALFVVAVWAWITAWKGGNAWPVSASFMALAFLVITVASAEQAIKLVQAASVLKAGVNLNATATATSPEGTATTTASGTSAPLNPWRSLPPKHPSSNRIPTNDLRPRPQIPRAPEGG